MTYAANFHNNQPILIPVYRHQQTQSAIMFFSKLLTASILVVSASAAAIDALEARSINDVLEVRDVGFLDKRERVVTCCRQIACFPFNLSVTCPCTKKETVACPEPVSLHA